MNEENGIQRPVVDELASMRQRIEEMEALQRTSLKAVSPLDLTTVLGSIAESALTLVGASDCLVYLYDRETGSFTFGTALGRWASRDKVLDPRPDGLTATVVREGRPVIINDAAHHPLYASSEAQQWNIRAAAGFPLRWAGQVLGVLHVLFVEPHAFCEEELRTLGLLADQAATAAAIAIGNSQLYALAQQEIAERKQAENNLLRSVAGQAVRQAALLRLSAELAATVDEKKVCSRVVDGLRDTLGYDFVALFLVDETTGDRVLAASTGFDKPPARMPPGKGLSEGPLLDGQLQYTQDVTQDPRYFVGMEGSEVDVPIWIGGKILGVLVAESKQRDAFDDDDFQVLIAAAQQVGLALEKARLLAEERRRADELDALRTTMADITAELELPALLRAIIERAAGLLGATSGELGLYEAATQEIRIVVSHNMDRDYVGTRLALDEGVMGHVARAGEPLIIGDYQTWEGRAPQYAGIDVRAGMAAPLTVGRRLVGVIALGTADPDRLFGPADLHLLDLFVRQAAIAVENARLFGETERRMAELATLTDVGKALTSTLRVDEVLQLIFDQTRRVMHAEDMLIVLYDRARHELECVFSTNPDDIPVGTRAPGDAGLVGGYILKHCRSLLLGRDVMEGARRLGLEPFGQPAASWLGVPMLRGEQVLGAIIVQHYTEPGTYDESHQVLLETIASQASVAFENARLYDRAQEEIAERVRAEEELRMIQERLEERVKERTAELQESEERYRSLFDGVPVGLYRTTPAGQFVDVNLAQIEIYGYPSRRELLMASNTASFYVDPGDRVHWQTLIEQEGVVRDFEARHRRYDGAVIWVNDTARAVKDEKGQVLYYEGSIEDITERKQVEQELREYREHLEDLVRARTTELQESEERYRTLFDGVPVGLYRTTPEGQVLDANLAAMQMLGYASREEALALINTADVYVEPSERARWQTLMEREGIVRDFEAQVRRHDGTVIWLRDTARAVKDEKGQVLYYEGSLEDVTERKRMEREILRQKEYYEALFVNSPVAVVTVGRDGNVVSWNPAAERLFGYTQAEAIGRNVDDLVATDDAVRAEATRYTRAFMGEGYRGAVEAYPDLIDDAGRLQATSKRTRQNGSLVDVSLLGLPVIVGGEEVEVIAIYNDITELQQARREAEAANRAKSTFLANMSHELRTPLNAILGFSQLMDGDPNLRADQQANLAIINRSGEHLLALINDVLEMSKIEAGQLALQETGFDLHDLLDGLEEMFRLRAEEKGLTLSFRRGGDVPRYVLADEGKLRQILSNLLGNAVKFTHEGGVALRASTFSPTLSEPQEGGVLHFEVEDTGPGIAPEELEAVFDPFVQASGGCDPVSIQAQEGSGLGLSISRQFVCLMGGELTLSSELGRGSLFRFDVQVGLAREAEVEATQPGQRVLGLAPDQRAADGGPYRVLVVEDRETNRRLLVSLLRDLGEPPLGFEVREASNGQEAIEVWERWQPHLIWMDMRMPVMDGHEATQRIKATPRGQHTVIIALTASAFEEDRERVLLEGCDDFVRKPYRKDEIYDLLAKRLGVQFVYEQEPTIGAPVGPVETGTPARALSAAAVAALPAGWLLDLQRATIRADLDLVLDLIDQIRDQDAALAYALTGLAQGYEYTEILAWIEQAGGENGS